jgi:4-amino-4-deoxy-L-arabinose transferase-like glycosyltransferase
MTGRAQWLLVAVACVVFVAQAATLLNRRWVEDESWLSIPAYTLAQEGRIRIPAFQGTGFKHEIERDVWVYPPGSVMLLSRVFKHIGTSVVTARAPFLLAGIGVIIGTFLLAREWAGPVAGVLGAFLAGADNLLFLAARTARPELFVPFFSVFAVWLYFLSRTGNSWLLAAGSGVVVGLGCWFHPNGIVAGAAIGVLMLVEMRARILFSRRAWVFAGAVLVVLAPFVLWLHSTPTHWRAFQIMYIETPKAMGAGLSFWDKAHTEVVTRYAQFVQFPYRVHVVAGIVGALLVLLAKHRRALGWLVVIIGLSLLWLISVQSKTIRYMAMLSPYFAIAVAMAAVSLSTSRAGKAIAASVCLLLAGSQMAGNAAFLYKFRGADYSQVRRELRALIPAGESVYGAITFWMALPDRDYMAYERTPFDQAVSRLHPTYLILNDRVMTGGMGTGADDWKELREQANAYAREYGDRVGQVQNPFYGDLDVYRIRYNP